MIALKTGLMTNFYYLQKWSNHQAYLTSSVKLIEQVSYFAIMYTYRSNNAKMFPGKALRSDEK